MVSKRYGVILVGLLSGCLEVTSDPHLPGGAIPLTPPLASPGQNQFAPPAPIAPSHSPFNPALTIEPNNTLSEISPTNPVEPTEPPVASGPRFVSLQQDWEAKGCSSIGACHDLDERTIVVKMNPDAERLLLNWAQIAPPEAGGEGVNAAGSVAHFAGGDSASLWQEWQAAGYPFVE